MIECGLSNIGSLLLLSFWVTKCVFVFKGMSVRVEVEDQILKDAFGEGWDEYARQVPKSFLPGVA